MTPSIPLADPVLGHVWSDDEPDLPDTLRLSPDAVAARADQRARIDAARAATPSTSNPGLAPASVMASASASASASADPAAHGLCRSRRRRGSSRSTTAATRARAAAARAEFESTTWPTFAPPALGTATGPMADVMTAERALASATATRARALSALADARPAAEDRPPGMPGAMSAERRAARPDVLTPVSEWVVRELRVSLAVTDHAADRMLVQALTLTQRLPGVLAALEGGLIHCGHLPALLELLDPIADDTLRARIEAELLRWLATRGAAGTITTPAQLRAKTHRVLLARDARTQAEQLRRALATRGVFTSPEPVAGMSGIHLRLTTAEAAALYAALDQLVDALPDDAGTGPHRTRAEKMVDILLDLVLRPGSSTHPPVQVSLTVITALETLLGSDTPGEIDGHLVPAAQIRALLDLLTGTHLAADAAADQADDADATADRATAGGAEEQAVHADTAVRVASGTTADTDPARHIAPVTRAPDRSTDGCWHYEPPPLDDATYWAMVDQLIANAPGPDDLWFSLDDPVWIHGATRSDDTTQPDGVTRPDGMPQPTDGARPELDAAPSTPAPSADVAEVSTSGTTRSTTDSLDATATATDSLDALRAALPADITAALDLLAATPATTSGGLTHRPRIALTHDLTGALISLTDLPGLRRAAATDTDLGAPPDTDTYHPTAALDRHIRTRDRRCRTPGCRRPASTGELDHHIPHPHGPTSATNLCGLCTTDHRGKHQAPGWHHHLHPDGTYTVTTPAGLTARTTPTPVL